MNNPDNTRIDDSALDRIQAVPALVGKHEDFLIVTGLAGTARDIAALTDDLKQRMALSRNGSSG